MNSAASSAFDQLRHQFVAGLPVRLDTLREHFDRIDLAAWQPAQAQALHRLVHAFTGSAGSFGMLSVSEAARALETRLAALLRTADAPARAPWQAIGAELQRLDQLARIQLESGSPSLKPPPAQPRLDRSPLIHLLEDDPAQAARLGQALRDDGYRVRVFTGSAGLRAAFATADAERPAAMVMDMILPEGDSAGAELLAELTAGKERCPPVVFVSVRDDLPARLAAFRAGASRYLAKPVETGRLIDLLDGLTGRQPPQPYRVLMVDDDPLLLELHASVLRAAGMDVRALSQPLRLLDALHDFTPDVVVLDVYMPDASGPELAAVLRERDEQRHLPILFLSAESDMTQQLLALDLGGDDFLVKPVQAAHLVAAITARARRARHNSAIRQRLTTSLYEREREHLALDQHAIVSIADRAGNITYVNDKFCEVSGYSRDELVGRNHRLLRSGEHPPEFYKEMWRSIASGKTWQGEICNRRRDGGRYWVESTITPFLDDEGKPYQYVAIRTDITKQKLAADELRQTRNLLNSIVEHIPAMVFLKRASDLRFELFNRAGENLLGYSRADLLGKGNYDLWPKEQGDWFTAADRKVLASREVTEIPEEPITIASGETRYLQTWKIALRDQGDEPTHLLGISVDITDRKLAEQAVEASKERLRRGQLFANIGTWEWNIQSGELFWTERIAPLFGYPTGELETSYENFLAAVHSDDRQSVIDAVNACVERDVPYAIEHRVVWPDGTVRWLMERGGVKRDAAGKPLQMLGVVQDIDDRKRAELALIERAQQLRQAQTMAHLGNWTADIVTGELNWSDEIYRIFGYEPGSFAPSVEVFHAVVHPDDRALVRASEQQAEKTGRHDVTHRIVRPDGTVRHVHELAQAEINAAGKLVRLSGTVQDITGQMLAEQALIAARDEADRASLAKSEFLSSMSHELRTPMNAVLGFGQLLEYDDTLSEEHRDNVREILKAGHHLLELINEVLDLAKIESGSINLSLEPVEVGTVIEECLNLIAPLADKHHIRISHGGLQGIWARADLVRLRQVLLNLLSNAIKYNRPDGSVRIEAQLQGSDRLRILVTDTGVGIPADRLGELFQPFHRLDAETNNIEGTGIGLTITRRIIEMMDGSVDVQSEVGVGSTFWIELPRETLAEGHRAKVAADHTAAEQDLDGAQHTVLYIEDNPSNIKLMVQLLGRRKSVRLLTAHTPELGIELALAFRPRLILLDINMPGMSGYQVLEVFKADARLKSIPVVAVTANAMPRDIERGMAMGFGDYLTKPLDIGRFNAVIDRLLQPGTQGKP